MTELSLLMIVLVVFSYLSISAPVTCCRLLFRCVLTTPTKLQLHRFTGANISGGLSHFSRGVNENESEWKWHRCVLNGASAPQPRPTTQPRFDCWSCCWREVWAGFVRHKDRLCVQRVTTPPKKAGYFLPIYKFSTSIPYKSDIKNNKKKKRSLYV